MRQIGPKTLALPVLVLTAVALVLAGGHNSSRSATNNGDPYHGTTVVDNDPRPHVVETTITAKPATVNIGNGIQAHALTFNGTIPGPTFRLELGDKVIVHFKNETGERTGIHWHGVEVPNGSDGTPLTQNQVKPGGTFRYEFKVTRPGIFWYHPHHHSSNNQVFKGMYGMIVVRDPIEFRPEVHNQLPPAERTLRLMLSDMTVCKAPGSNDAVTYDPSLPHVSGGPLPAQGAPTPKDLCETSPVDEDGNPRAPFAAGDIPNIQQKDPLAKTTNEGQTVLTNGVNVGGRAGSPEAPGALAPGAKTILAIGNQQYRLEIANAATTRYMRLRLTTPSGQISPLLRIGGEGGLIDKARIEGGLQGTFSYDTQYTKGEILLPPGGRADVLARMRQGTFSGATPPEPGIYTLWTEDYLRSAVGFANTPSVPVMHFQVLPDAGNNFNQGVLFGGTQIRPPDSPVDVLPLATAQPLDPATFQPAKPGMASGQIGLSVGANGFSVDGIHGTHDDGGDFMQASHPASARYVKAGQTYALAVANQSATRHPFHLHGFSIQPLNLTRIGHTTPIYTWDYAEFVDTVDIPAAHILNFRVRIDKRPMAGNSDGTAGGEIGRWVLHCHIFHHAEGGMLSELVVLNTIFKSNERPQMTIDNVDVTGIRGQTVTATGSYRDPDGDGVSFFEPRDVDTGETLGKITKDGTSSGRWTWTYPVSATDPDRRVKIAESDSRFEVAQMVLDLHVKDAPAEPAPTPAPTTETPAPTPNTETPTTEPPTPQTIPAVVDRTAPAIRSVRVTRLARALRTQLRLSERARLTVTVKRGRRRVARVLKVGVAGRNTVNVRKAFGPGRYTVIVQAVDLAGNRGKSVAIRLTVPKG
jgi:FtsP/CotA-like multicopper oxidase with cupredoxin domain